MAREEFDEDSPEWVEFGRRVFARECRFIAGAVRIAQLPETGAVPEIAFAGRSNVGKSSLVNALTGRKTLARTSNSPGRTQELNFFDLSGHLVLADLPGYGFASAPKAKVMQWTALADSYLKGRPSLRRVCILIDARHGVKDVDRRVMTMLDEAAVFLPDGADQERQDHRVATARVDRGNRAGIGPPRRGPSPNHADQRPHGRRHPRTSSSPGGAGGAPGFDIGRLEIG